MAFSSGLTAAYADFKLYCERVLQLQVAPIDLQWITKLVFNKQLDVIKFAYCLHTIKCENEGREVTAPGYCTGILDLEGSILRLLQYREDYWKGKTPLLHFLNNVDFDFLRPSPRAPTREQGTSTTNEFAVPQDVRQKPAEYSTRAAGRSRDAAHQSIQLHFEASPAESRVPNGAASISTNPKIRKRPSNIRREDQAMYVIPAKRKRMTSPSCSEEDSENWEA